jgi:two-component system chemotaxis response regulator CheB
MPTQALALARPILTEKPPIRLLIVDDSAVARAVFSRIIGDRPQFELAAAVSSAPAALAFLARERVDIILLDIEMPGQDGLSALPGLLDASAGARVLIVSSSAEQGAAATIRALTLGAADTLAKPGIGTFGTRFADVLAEKLLRIGPAPKARQASNPAQPPAPVVQLRPLGRQRVSCLAIGASTGGLHALSDFLRALPPAFAPPILITQHLPAAFMPIFARQVQEMSGRPTSVAEPGAALTRGEILVAPGQGHLCVELAGRAPRVRITHERSESGCMPSVDPMLTSVAEVFGASGLGIVLSGMGRDGLRGAERLATIGADLFVQDRETSVVWGMPGAVAKAGLASAMLPPLQLAELLTRRDRPAI